MKNLVVVRAGNASLHPLWLLRDPDRNWHLHISYYGDRRDPYPLDENTTISWDPGQKWIGVSSCLRENPKLLEYDQIAFPDDDLKFSTGNWSQLFNFSKNIGAMMAQPSLDHRSFYGHDVTLRRSWLDYRIVNFIELMCPIFSGKFLSDIRGNFEENKSSLGIDYIWSQAVINLGGTMAISDQCSVLHTRAIGKGAQYDGLNPAEEMHQLLEKHNIVAWKGRSIEAYVGGKRVNSYIANRKEFMPRVYGRMKRFMNLDLIG